MTGQFNQSCRAIDCRCGQTNSILRRQAAGFEWHQDAPYWTPVSDSVAEMPNAMVALDQASKLLAAFGEFAVAI